MLAIPCVAHDQARETARAFLDRWPSAAYLSAVESWSALPDDEIEFTMRRLRSADQAEPRVAKIFRSALLKSESRFSKWIFAAAMRPPGAPEGPGN